MNELFIMRFNQEIDVTRYDKILSNYRLRKIKGSLLSHNVQTNICIELLLIYALKTRLPNLHLPLDIEIKGNGKPFLKNASIFYNCSHSKDGYAVAISSNDIGVDIEATRYIENRLAKNYFDEILYKTWLQFDARDQTHVYLNYWVKRESHTKLYSDSIYNIHEKIIVRDDSVISSCGSSFHVTKIVNGFYASVATFTKQDLVIKEVSGDTLLNFFETLC